MRPLKCIYLFVIILASFAFLGCAKSIGNSLLTDFKSTCTSSSTSVDCVDTSGADALQTDIQANSSTMVLNMESSDTVEITGTCKDLDRRKNRILVEVFAGEDETTEPYISNAESSNCLTTSVASVQSGLTSASGKCFWVTKGVGLIDDAGLPSEKIFPQCHNGQFGFSVKLGKILVNPTPGQANLKYLVRMKLRTQEGTISDTVWSRVVIDRGLSTPVISSVAYDATKFKCSINAAPARFNLGILYALNRTYTDSVATAAGATAVYAGLSSSTITAGASIFNWDNFGVVEGVTYNYILTSTESNYAYTTAPTASSAAATCEVSRPTIASLTPSAGTCPMYISSAVNPYWGTTVTYEWGYVANNVNWTSVDGIANANVTVTTASCGNAIACTQSGLVSGTTYGFAVRARGASGEVGKWSPITACRP